MMTLNELWRIIQDIWATGNRWARWAISVIVGWPIALLAYALLNPSIGAASLMALIPVIALFMLVMTRVDPMVLAVLSAFKAGRTALKTISTVVGIELVIGVYCTLVRIGNDPELAMLLILFLVTYIFLAMGIKGNGLIWFAKFVCVMGMIALTAVFIFGGREKIGAEKANRYSAATIYQEIFPPPDLPGFWQDGLYVAPQKTKAVDGKKPNIISATKRAWGEQIAIKYNCDQDLVLTTLKGNETLTITHDTTKLLLKDQRCSYSMTGDNFPVYGIRNGKSLSQYENL
ncbi:hypothetical protein HYR65_02020, partial [Candidatus Azambacteria bacterium]|nr:hypothetical protein [Candidatus Azambacteria bacterium]